MLPLPCLAQAWWKQVAAAAPCMVSPSLFDFSVVFGVLLLKSVLIWLWFYDGHAPRKPPTMDGNVSKTARIMSEQVPLWLKNRLFCWEIWQRHVNNGNPYATPFFKKHAVDSTSVSTPGVYNSRSFPWRPIASVHMGAVLKPMQGF